MEFSEVDNSNLDFTEVEKKKLILEKEPLEKIIKEFQNDLTPKNKGNLEFIKFLIQKIKKDTIDIPVLPEIANKILRLSNNENSTFNDYSSIVKNDPAIVMKIIKLANSPMYRGLRDVSSITLAMTRIGIDGIKEIVLTESLNSIIFKNKRFKKHVDKIWKDSILIALLSSKISKLFKINSSLVYTISLVHRIGSILIFDIVEEFNKSTDFENYLGEDFSLRISNTFNKRLTIKVLENWYFTKKQLISVKNYDIKPIPVASLEHKILYLSRITIEALDIILNDYDNKALFPYIFMLKESSLDLKPDTLKEMTEKSYKYYTEFLENLYNN